MRQCEAGQDLLVGSGEGEFVELRKREPIAFGLGAQVREFSAPDFERDARAGDGVFDGAEGLARGGAKIRRTEPFASARPRPGFSVGGVRGRGGMRDGFEIREFPEVRVDHASRPLAHEESPVAFDDEGEEAAGDGGRRLSEVGELVLQIQFSRDTEFVHRAGIALRRARRTNERAEFHKRLVEMGAG